MVREEANDKKILKNNYKILSIFKCFVESIRIKIKKIFDGNTRHNIDKY